MRQTSLDHLIELLRPQCEYMMLHAENDGWTVADLMQSRVGVTIKFIEYPKAMEFTGPNIEACLSKAWKRRP